MKDQGVQQRLPLLQCRHEPGNEACHHRWPPHYSRYKHSYQVNSVSQPRYLPGRESHGLRCWSCDGEESDCDDTSNHEAEQCQDSESVCLR